MFKKSNWRRALHVAACFLNRRLRFRFSIRTLLIMLTVVGVYLACWEPTKKWGCADVTENVSYLDIDPFNGTVDTRVLLPLVVENTTADYGTLRNSVTRRFVWLFGYVVELPYERSSPYLMQENYREFVNRLYDINAMAIPFPEDAPLESLPSQETWDRIKEARRRDATS